MTAITAYVEGDIPPAVQPRPRPLTRDQQGVLAILRSYDKTMRGKGDTATADLLRVVCAVIEDGMSADAARELRGLHERGALGALP